MHFKRSQTPLQRTCEAHTNLILNKNSYDLESREYNWIYRSLSYRAERIWFTSVPRNWFRNYSHSFHTCRWTLTKGHYYRVSKRNVITHRRVENIHETAATSLVSRIRISSLFHLLYCINLFRILPGFFLHSNSSLLRNISAWIYTGGRRVRFPNSDCWIAIDGLKYVPPYESIYSEILTDALTK